MTDRNPPRDSPQLGAVRFAGLLVLAALAALAPLWTTASWAVWLSVPLGLVLVLGAPTYLLRYRLRWLGSSGITPWLLSLGATLVALMVVPALWNAIGPAVGISRPLDTLPFVALLSVGLSGLFVWRHAEAGRARIDARLRAPVVVGWRDQVLVVGGVVFVVATVAGAIRLNNHLPGTAATTARGLGIVVVVIAFTWLGRLKEGTVLMVIYLVGLGLLLANSLRGWEVTGHDIQIEQQLFQLTFDRARWLPTEPSSAYNACLSITVLPTLLAKVTHLPTIYVFRVFFQALFAVAPLIVYRIGRHLTRRNLAFVGAVYFMIFPTFGMDMSFLNRQEIAFLLIGLVTIVVVDPLQVALEDPGPRSAHRGFARVQRRWRTRWMLGLSVGVIVAHYSTNYVYLASLAFGYLVYLVVSRSVSHGWFRGLPRRAVELRPAILLTPGIILALGLATVVWTGPITHSGGQLELTIGNAVGSFTQSANQTASSDTKYSLLSGIFGGKAQLSPQQRLDQYRAQTIEATPKERADGTVFPLSIVDRFATPVVEAPVQPLTSLGAGLTARGIPVATIIALIRALAAMAFQVFVLIGIGVVLAGRAPMRRFSSEFVALVVANLFLIGTQVAIPAFSVDYGLLRAFQQSLFLLAPLLAVGTYAAARLLGKKVARWGAEGLAAAMFLVLSGILTQIFGGYSVILPLANAGLYYNNYYVHPQEVAGLDWLAAQTLQSGSFQTEVVTDRYTIAHLRNISPLLAANDDIYPTGVRVNSYVFLGTPAVQHDEVSVFFTGDIITYHYPIAFLQSTKNLVYSNGGAEVYR